MEEAGSEIPCLIVYADVLSDLFSLISRWTIVCIYSLRREVRVHEAT